MDKLKRFEEITKEMVFLYEAKNEDYGDSFGKSCDEWGLVVGAIRLGDKYNRLCSLIKGKEAKVEDEPLIDTLTDMANFAIMLRMEIEKRERKQNAD